MVLASPKPSVETLYTALSQMYPTAAGDASVIHMSQQLGISRPTTHFFPLFTQSLVATHVTDKCQLRQYKAVPSFIFVSRPREGRFLASQEEKKTIFFFSSSHLFFF